MAFLSPVVGPILTQIGSLLLSEYARINGISDKLNAWVRKLRMIQAVLDSAEQKQMDGEPTAHQWLSDLREVSFDIEDLLHEFSVDAKRNSSQVQALSRSAKLPYSLIACCSRFDPRTLISDHHMANEIEEVDRRLQEVFDDIPLLGVIQNQRSGSPSPANFGQSRFVTTSLPEPKFVGREKQMEELLARLTQSESTDDSVRPFTVVSIVGMGGIGKTTLAQELYGYEPAVKEAFQVKAWVCVSDVFDRFAITKSILDQIAPSSSGTEKDLNLLQNLLKEKLVRNKFLIVLDDVWNDKYEEIESLLKPLHWGSKGSRILLTTRNLEVARLVGDGNPTKLDTLPLEECLSLLAYHSIGKENFESHPRLQDIAVRLVEKCKGLPLAIKTIGGLLHFESDDEKWKEVLTHGIWDKEDGKGKIPPALKLSYFHLPFHLKRCFAACALFPKDYLFDQDEVIQLWITQGLLEKGTAETYREIGMKYIRRLEVVSLLQKARDEKTCYLMHDLINDLAKSVVAGTYFSSDEYKEGSSGEESLSKVRHAAMVTQSFENCLSRKFDVYRSMKKLRTFMPFRIPRSFSFEDAYVSDKVIHDLIMDKKNMRMLSLCHFTVRELPDKIGELKLLRYINLSHTLIDELPDSICDLVELQSLLLRGCSWLKKLPRNIHKLTNLLHLDITGTENLEEMPPHIGDMTKLEILSDFVVGNGAGRELKQLGRLKCLQRELHVRNLVDVNDIEDARIANLREKDAVLELSFDWGSSSESSSKDDHQLKVLDHLQPPRKIESLAIHYYGGKEFPSWFGNSCMNNVVSITLENCKNVDLLPSFGQLPLLETLSISGLEAVSSIGAEFYGGKNPFRSLKSLRFTNMEAWEKWSSHGDEENDFPFPCLRVLQVTSCPKLNGGCTLSLPSLLEIDIEGCNEGWLKCLVELTSVTKMNISNIPQLIHFDESLSSSWVALEDLRIKSCPRFKSLVDGDARKQVPPKLKILRIRHCEGIEKLPDSLSELTYLDEIYIHNCKNLSSFPSTVLPHSLRKVVLRNCPSLPSPQFISCRLPDSLEEIILKDIVGLVLSTNIAVGIHLSRSLRVLSISGCGSVTTLPDSLQHLSTLSELSLKNCGALDIDCVPALPCNLSSFKLVGCPKVKSLPHEINKHTSLKRLDIRACDGITSLPRGGLPPNLEYLRLAKCRKLCQPFEEWGLHGLITLRELWIEGEMECVNKMECFPPCPNGESDAWHLLLPSSLVDLYMREMKKLERVGSGLRVHLTSLQSVWIVDCPRLRWLPDDGLPDTVERLGILNCPEMRKRCLNPKGEYWPIIQLIPDLHIVLLESGLQILMQVMLAMTSFWRMEIVGRSCSMVGSLIPNSSFIATT